MVASSARPLTVAIIGAGPGKTDSLVLMELHEIWQMIRGEAARQKALSFLCCIEFMISLNAAMFVFNFDYNQEECSFAMR